jgi:hypothetical protein
MATITRRAYRVFEPRAEGSLGDWAGARGEAMVPFEHPSALSVRSGHLDGPA